MKKDENDLERHTFEVHETDLSVPAGLIILRLRWLEIRPLAGRVDQLYQTATYKLSGISVRGIGNNGTCLSHCPGWLAGWPQSSVQLQPLEAGNRAPEERVPSNLHLSYFCALLPHQLLHVLIQVP